MMNDWKKYKLGEVVSIKYGKDHKNLNDGPYPVYGSGGIMRYVDKYLYDKESILIPRKGSLNNIFYQDNAFWTVDTMFWSEINTVKAFPKFLFYQLSLVDFENLNVGSAVPSLTIPIINDVDVSLPSLEEQRRIAGVLSSLDDKIDLLNRENATLEALAETLFRHYFIENPDPTWKEGKVSDVSFHCKDSINPQKHSDKTFLHYSIPAYDNGQRPTEEQGQNIQSNKYVVPQNCILFSKLNPHRDKRVWLMLDDVQPNAICSTEFQIVKPQDDKWLYFLYGWLTYKENYDKIASGVSGTSSSHQRIEPNVIFDNDCQIVNDVNVTKYNAQVKSLFKKIKTNQQQILSLSAQRDTLLPRLMSGEMRIGE